MYAILAKRALRLLTVSMSNDSETPDSKKDSLGEFQQAKDNSVENHSAPTTSAAVGRHRKSALSPLTVLCILIGLLIIISGILLFVFGHKPDGIIFEMTNKKRAVLAGFIALLGSGTIFLGLKHNLSKAFITAAVAGGSLLAMPFIYKNAYIKERQELYAQRAQATQNQNLTDTTNQPNNTSIPAPTPNSPALTAPDNTQSEEEILKQIIGYNRIQQLAEKRPNLTTVSMVLEGVDNLHTKEIQDYYQTTLENKINGSSVKVTVEPTYFPIEDKPSQLVVIQHDFENEEPINLAHLFFNTAIIPSKLENVSFMKVTPYYLQSARTLNDQETFNTLLTASNQLFKLSPKSQLAAMNCIQNCDTLINGPTILITLNYLLQTRDKEFKIQVIKTIDHWVSIIKKNPKVLTKSEPIIKDTLSKVITEIHTLIENGHQIDSTIIDIIDTHQIQDAEDIIYTIWAQSPLAMESRIIKLKNKGLDALLKNFSSMDSAKILSASSIFKKNGRTSDIPALQALLENSSSEKISTSLRSTIDAIKNRP